MDFLPTSILLSYLGGIQQPPHRALSNLMLIGLDKSSCISHCPGRFGPSCYQDAFRKSARRYLLTRGTPSAPKYPLSPVAFFLSFGSCLILHTDPFSITLTRTSAATGCLATCTPDTQRLIASMSSGQKPGQFLLRRKMPRQVLLGFRYQTWHTICN
ncbi:hypothetical protein B0H66DRAFT_335614 [Apodospora peruviana]|uniref:Uncharacterized protein n=1 Tax=Apodospora peruviana TaxID=516989 RepID=A0AAE0HYF0_9PEZI|nr:hypothetical protein B0H66DRAFT_335614 [Apodospora peruviana]